MKSFCQANCSFRFRVVQFSVVIGVGSLLLGCEAKPKAELEPQEKVHTPEVSPAVPVEEILEAAPRASTEKDLDPRAKFPEEDGVYLLYINGCLTGRSLRDVIIEMKSRTPSLPIDWLDWGKMSGDVKSRFEVAGGTPWMVAIKGGRVQEAHIGAQLNINPNGEERNQDLVLHMLRRNGLQSGDLASLLFTPPGVESGDLYGMKNLDGEIFSVMDLSGIEWSGRILERVHFNGSDLQNADLSGAILDGSNFSHANLKGAKMTGASVKRVNWSFATCPDGWKAPFGGSCEDHLDVR